MGHVYLIMNAHGMLAECRRAVYNVSPLEVLVVKNKEKKDRKQIIVS